MQSGTGSPSCGRRRVHVAGQIRTRAEAFARGRAKLPGEAPATNAISENAPVLRAHAQKLQVMSGAGISVQARYPWLPVLLTDVHSLCPSLGVSCAQ